MTIIGLLVILFLFFVAVLILVFKNDILVLLFPNDYNKILMEEKSGNVLLMVKKKGKDLSFKFRNGIYFMYYVEKVVSYDSKLKPPKFNDKPLLRMGNLGFFKFKEGYSYPEKDNIIIDSEAGYNQSILEQKYSELLFEKSIFDDSLFKYLLIGAGVIVVIILVYVFFFKQASVT